MRDKPKATVPLLPASRGWLWCLLAMPMVLLFHGTAKAPIIRQPGGRPPVVPKPAPSRASVEFKAVTLDGWRFDFRKTNTRRRVVVYLFEPKARLAGSATRAAEQLHKERHEHNLAIIGVMAPPGFHPSRPVRASQAIMTRLASSYLDKAGTTFPCIVDPDGAITNLYTQAAARRHREVLPAFVVFPVRGQGQGGGGLLASDAAKTPEPADYLRRSVLKMFGIEPTGAAEPLAGDYPKAPDVALVDTTGRTHRLSDYRGHVTVIVFLMRTCHMCKDELTFLGRLLASHGRREGPALKLIGVCVDAEGAALKRFVAERGYTFPVCADPDWAIRTAFGYRGSVPDTFVIAPDGTVRYRHRDHTAALDSVLHMEIRTLLGLETMPLLGPARYSGDRACRVCHAKQHADWALTRHACAWETLVRTGRQTDPECVRCHVVGYRERGGFVNEKDSGHLVDVQCEACHGGNGCKAFTGRDAGPIAARVCEKCHDAKHSPRFDFAQAQPRVLHNRADKLAKLPRAEREKELKRLCSGAKRELFDPDAAYAGSLACKECHPTAYEALRDKPHTVATARLARPAPDHWTVPRHKRGVVGIRKAECLRCHVTGYGRPGGFPADVPDEPASHALAGVGCEACHGPGKEHCDDPKKPRAIARLSGTCNECNVLPICRQCHDDTNSPEFDYRTALPSARHPAGDASQGYK
jgi:peroxiredoxin